MNMIRVCVMCLCILYVIPKSLKRKDFGCKSKVCGGGGEPVHSAGPGLGPARSYCHCMPAPAARTHWPSALSAVQRPQALPRGQRGREGRRGGGTRPPCRARARARPPLLPMQPRLQGPPPPGRRQHHKMCCYVLHPAATC
jgi:hypothetical protein